jgi:hypothetical protein
MSALGQKQTFAAQEVMSALPRKQNLRCKNKCPLGPKADIDYSITSSTRSKIDVGTVIPRFFAVFRFTTS